MRNAVSKFLIIIGTAALASACAVSPHQISDKERAERAVSDLETMFKGQDPVKEPISLSEAIARAVKYNLDHRVKLMEKAVVRAESELARMDLLPAITADAGYTTRSNVAASSSESILTGRQSLEPSTSQERTRSLANLNVVWNVLDFGVSYVTAQQRADRILIAEEERRKAVENIVQDVRVAYWNAVAADQLTKETDELLERTHKALKESQTMQAQGVQTPLTSMQYQEGLLATLRNLLQLRQRLNTAKTELASLMNVRPGTDFQLQPDDIDRQVPEIKTVVPELEEYGLLHRPELIEEDYRLQVDSAEIRKAMLRMLPGIEINAGVHYDSNDFLVNNDWADAGLRISWNLFNLFRAPKEKKRAQAQVDLDNTRRLATGMAVLTQINVAKQQYKNSREDYRLAQNLLEVKTDIAEQERSRYKAQVSDELTLIRTRLDRLVALMQRDLAFAELQNAAGRVHNSVGLDPLPPTVKADDLETLTLAVRTQQESLSGMLAKSQLDPNLYDEVERKIAMERAQKRREDALNDKEAAEAALAEAARSRAEQEEAANKAKEQAAAAQQTAIEAAVKQEDAKRAAQAKAAQQLQELADKQKEAAERQKEADAARKAAEEAASAAAAAEAAAKAQQEAANKAAAERQAELEQIAKHVQAQIDQAVEAAVSAGQARVKVENATEEQHNAEKRVQDIVIPEVPESGAAGSSGGEDTSYVPELLPEVRTMHEDPIPVEERVDSAVAQVASARHARVALATRPAATTAAVVALTRHLEAAEVALRAPETSAWRITEGVATSHQAEPVAIAYPAHGFSQNGLYAAVGIEAPRPAVTSGREAPGASEELAAVPEPLTNPMARMGRMIREPERVRPTDVADVIR